MRAAAPVQVALCRFGIWRAAVCGVALASLTVIGRWLTQTMPAPSVGVIVSALAAAVIVGRSAWHLLRIRPASLRWDGVIWHLGLLQQVGDEPSSGQLDVAIDLGVWMLLRFRPDASSVGVSTTWLPVQRMGLVPQWHAFRCAVYSPRPPLGVAPQADL